MTHPRTLGQGLKSWERLPTGSARDAKNRVPRWQAVKQRHEPGVVSPESLENLAPLRRGETDRNTDLT
jgi:hypothetical protein